MKYKVEKYETSIVTLDDEELKKLLNWDAGKYSFVRDVFIFACMTSLRYSDIITLKKQHIKNNIITKVAEKSRKGKEVYMVELNNIALDILERNNYILNKYQLQPFNRLLQEMSEKCGFFNEVVEYNVYREGVKIIEKDYKYNLISSHTARRTFITRCVEKGVPLNQIMKMTSHTKLDTLLKYINRETPNKNYIKSLEL
jgi:integrase